MTDIILYWMRQDLRVADNPALLWAAKRGRVVPLYILDSDTPSAAQMGAASAWWLHHALEDLGAAFAKLGAHLILRKGSPLKIIRQMAGEMGAKAVTWNRCYEPYARKRDDALQKALEAKDLEVVTHNGSLLVEPWEVKTGTGGFYKVYTPFSRACLKLGVATPTRAPSKLATVASLKGDPLNTWKLLPTHPDWSGGIGRQWDATVRGGHEQLKRFLSKAIERYQTGRNEPGIEGTSRMSPYLHFGQLSPRQIWHAVVEAEGSGRAGSEVYLKELLWREFSYHLLYHFPELPFAPFNKRFARSVWKGSKAELHAWQRGRTGYPIVDAGMRQLWQTGWMHNRIRMVVASFLVKDLLISWQEGAAWFWDTLVDADLANNSAQWQWVAGCGADAAPYFRVFNPVTQGKKFDRDGAYVKRFVPELSKLPPRYLHAPWLAPEEVLKKAGIVLGKTYPQPLVDHDQARLRALKLLKKMPRSA